LIAAGSWDGTNYEFPDNDDDFLDCDAGFYCPIGSSVVTGSDVYVEFGVDDNWDGLYSDAAETVGIDYIEDYVIGGTTGGSCPSGFYCKAGTLAPEPCPIGTYGLGR
jgi:hypothetical protein